MRISSIYLAGFDGDDYLIDDDEALEVQRYFNLNDIIFYLPGSTVI